MTDIFSSGTSTDDPGPDKLLTLEVMMEAVEKMKFQVAPLYYYSGTIEADDIYKMTPDELSFNSWHLGFDKAVKTVYICGRNVRDRLIKEGINFQNFYPEHEEK